MLIDEIRIAALASGADTILLEQLGEHLRCCTVQRAGPADAKNHSRGKGLHVQFDRSRRSQESCRPQSTSTKVGGSIQKCATAWWSWSDSNQRPDCYQCGSSPTAAST